MITKDCLLVYLPFNPIIYTPLLGLGVLQAHIEQANLSVDIIDLNFEFLNDKVHQGDKIFSGMDFFEEYRKTFYLPEIDPERIPNSSSIINAYPYNFDEIDDMISSISEDNFWYKFIKELIIDKYSPVPVLGVSLIGGGQTLLALLVAALVKKMWPETTVVAGGTHITLLKDQIISNEHYGRYIDYFFVGHCEDIFSKFLLAKINNKPYSDTGIIVAGTQCYTPYEELIPEKRLAPSYDSEYIAEFNKNKLVFPLQFRRGCPFNCRYCTFHAVEKLDKNFPYEQEFTKHIKSMQKWNPKRISIRDSLLRFDSMLMFGKLLHQYFPNTTWRASTKPDKNITAEGVKELYKYNLRVVELGIETIHPKTQRLVNKIQDLNVINNLIDILASNGVNVQINLMFGFPGETEKDALKQLEWYYSRIEKYDNVYGILGMLVMARKSSFHLTSEKYGIKIQPFAPWADLCVWNQPSWCESFEQKYLLNYDKCAFTLENSDKLHFI